MADPSGRAEKIAFWGYKTAIMLALATTADARYVPAEHYEYIYKERTPPNDVFVWIAALAPIKGDVLSAGFSKPERLDYLTASGETHFGYRLSFSALSLVFQFVFDPLGGKLDRPRELRKVWTRIRPISKGDWPLQFCLGPNHLATLGQGRILT